MKSILLTVVLFGISMYVTLYSSGFLFIMLPVLLGAAVLSTGLLAIWFTGSYKARLLRASRFAFPAVPLVFLLGYAYETIRVL